MSGDGFAAKRRAAKTEDAQSNARLREGPSLMDALKEQAPAMTGMAMMFVVTILLAMSIQDFYDKDELRAFGDSGSTKAGFIFMELIFIFIFTAGVIFLARKGMEKFIRGGVLFVLWIAMIYTLVPLSHMLLGEQAPPLILDDENVTESHILAVDEDGAGFYLYEPNLGENGSISYMKNAGGGEGNYSGAVVMWTHPISHDAMQEPTEPQISVTEGGVILCEGTRWALLDKDTGEEIDSSQMDCLLGLRYESTDPDWENCDGHEVPQDWLIIGRVLYPIPHFHDTENSQVCAGQMGNWMRTLPEGFNSEEVLFVREVGDEHFLIVSKHWAGMVEYPTIGISGSHPGEVSTTWEKKLDGGEQFTSVAYGTAPGDSLEVEELLLVLGTNDGSVTGWSVNQSGVVEEESSMKFDSNDAFDEPIRGLLLADCCSGGSNDLWVLEGNELQIFMGKSLNEQPRNLKIGGENHVFMTLHNVENEDSSWDSGILLIEQDGNWTSSTYTAYEPNFAFVISGVGVQWFEIVSFVLSIALMVALIRYPEWYVVNTVGIIVGAGVITILGVSFDEWLIILFMVLAACYDAWAVYRSKHMLELADTMIGLKLPILLVAPQDKEYSFRDEGESVMVEKADTSASAQVEKSQNDGTVPEPRPIRKEGGEAMFMGLGDVIFPGMLCISAMTWLPVMDGPMGLAASTWVALGTMLGGLVGYFCLMTYVARGRPQAGLPLLNGGAILGYFISAAIFVGSSAFAFNISLF